MSHPRTRILLVILVLLATGVVAGCGGDDSSASPGGATQTARLGPAGGQLSDPADGVVITVPQGSLITTTTVTMNVTHTHSSAVTQIADEGRALSDVGVGLTLTPLAFAPNGSVTIRMALAGAYDPLYSTMAIANADEIILAIPSQRSTDGTGIVGTLNATTLLLLTAGHLGDANTLEVFTTNRLGGITAPAASGCVLRFDPPSDATDCSAAPVCGQPDICWTGTIGDLTQMRVAVLVPGFDANLGDLHSLAAHLRGLMRPEDSAPYYDAVIGFQYLTDTALADIGGLMAQQVAPLLQSTQITVDVFAHSMGVVVSRYAMETTSLDANRLGSKVTHFVALGGPNTGVPFAKGEFLQTLLLHLRTKTAPALMDLVTDGKDGSPLPGHPFLTNLNLSPGSTGPDFAAAHYFSLSGDDYQGETFKGIKIGDVINLLYVITAGPSVIDDGLVATYSAQSDVLGRQSMSWMAGPTLHVSHFDLHEAAAFPTIDGWIEGF